MKSGATAFTVREIALAVRRLRPDWQNPERYFEDRDEIEHRLRRLARDLDGSRND